MREFLALVIATVVIKALLHGGNPLVAVGHLVGGVVLGGLLALALPVFVIWVCTWFI